LSETDAEPHDPLRRSACRYCDHELAAPFLELGAMPLANSFTNGAVSPDEEFKCPLSVAYCGQCHLVQLTHVVPPHKMFSHYLYVSSTSNTFLRHFRDYAAAVCGWFPKNGAGLAVDLGSNDGLLVKSFLEHGVAAIGVEPAKNLSDEANRQGIPTINRYFDDVCVKTIVSERGQAGVVTANNLFAHVDGVSAFCQNVHALLREDGLFLIEFPYLVKMCQEMLFDMIYHEHCSYLSVSAVHYILRKHGFEILDIQEVPSHGGSLRVIGQKAGGPRQSDGKWMQYVTREREGGYQSPAVYSNFAAKVQSVKARLRAFVAALRLQGRTIAGYGAPAKANTLINFCEWSSGDIEYLVDDNSFKQGLYAPGSGIQVVSPQRLIEKPPDAVIVFAWNFAEEIIEKMRPLLPGDVGWIIPLPVPNYL